MDLLNMLNSAGTATAAAGGGGAGGGNQQGGGGGGNYRRRTRGQAEEYVPRQRNRGQRPVDTFSSIIAYLDRKKHSASSNPFTFHVPPHEYYCKDVLPPFATAFNPATALCTQWAHTSQYPDNRGPGSFRRRVGYVNMKWSASGRKLLCSTSGGEFLLYNGASFTCEMKTLAHRSDAAVRALTWGSKSGLIISGDDAGGVKVWSSHFSLAAEITNANQRAIRDVSFSPSELRFCTSGQDGTVAIWDIERIGSSSLVKGDMVETAEGENNNNNVLIDEGENQQQQQQQEEQQQQIERGKNEPDVKLSGHGGDVLSCRWHPHRCLVATASQDKDVRLWDPRTSAASIATLSAHGEPAFAVRWHELGRESWLLSSSKDGTVRLWDTRMIRHEQSMYSGHTRGVNCLEWHPTHPDLFVSGGMDGLVAFWMVSPGEGTLRPNGVTHEVSKFAAGIDAAHDKFRSEPNPVQSLAFAPLGHLLATGGNEVHIWTRNRPGALEEMRFEASDLAEAEGAMPNPGESALGNAW